MPHIEQKTAFQMLAFLQELKKNGEFHPNDKDTIAGIIHEILTATEFEVTIEEFQTKFKEKWETYKYPDDWEMNERGSKNIKYHIDYMAWLLEQRRWLAGEVMTLADFAAAAHFSTLDYLSDIDWSRSNAVKDWYAKIKSRPAFRNLLADQVSGFPPPVHYNDLDF